MSNYYPKNTKPGKGTLPCAEEDISKCPFMHSGCLQTSSCIPPTITKAPLDYTVAVPITLAKSLEGKYFVGNSGLLTFGNGTNAWARLYNPPNSRVNLFVTAWTVSNLTDAPFRAQIYFNSTPPGAPMESSLISPANTAFCPLPSPKIKLQYASSVTGEPTGGAQTFARRIPPQSTVAEDEDGKFIFPPGGSFLVFLSNPGAPDLKLSGEIAFGWWEEPICK